MIRLLSILALLLTSFTAAQAQSYIIWYQGGEIAYYGFLDYDSATLAKFPEQVTVTSLVYSYGWNPTSGTDNVPYTTSTVNGKTVVSFTSPVAKGGGGYVGDEEPIWNEGHSSLKITYNVTGLPSITVTWGMFVAQGPGEPLIAERAPSLALAPALLNDELHEGTEYEIQLPGSSYVMSVTHHWGSLNPDYDFVDWVYTAPAGLTFTTHMRQGEAWVELPAWDTIVIKYRFGPIIVTKTYDLIP